MTCAWCHDLTWVRPCANFATSDSINVCKSLLRLALKLVLRLLCKRVIRFLGIYLTTLHVTSQWLWLHFQWISGRVFESNQVSSEVGRRCQRVYGKSVGNEHQFLSNIFQLIQQFIALGTRAGGGRGGTVGNIYMICVINLCHFTGNWPGICGLFAGIICGKIQRRKFDAADRCLASASWGRDSNEVHSREYFAIIFDDIVDELHTSGNVHVKASE